MASDWATKGAHLHVGRDEVIIYPTHEGTIGAKPYRMEHGWASDRSVQQALDALHSDPALRQDLIDKSRAAMNEMQITVDEEGKKKGNWGNEKSRAIEMHFLIKALEKMNE